MAERGQLHKSHLPAFRAWLDAKGIEHRPGRGFYEVMQLKHGGGWPAIFTRAHAPEHVSVPTTLWPLVRSFLRERSEP